MAFPYYFDFVQSNLLQVDLLVELELAGSRPAPDDPSDASRSCQHSLEELLVKLNRRQVHLRQASRNLVLALEVPVEKLARALGGVTIARGNRVHRRTSPVSAGDQRRGSDR